MVKQYGKKCTQRMQQRAHAHEGPYPKGVNLKCCQLFTLVFPVVVAATEPDPMID